MSGTEGLVSAHNHGECLYILGLVSSSTIGQVTSGPFWLILQLNIGPIQGKTNLLSKDSHKIMRWMRGITQPE